MLENKEYSEITVLDLVADSNVNRNTFYYHFKDLDGLIAEIARRAADACLNACKGNASDKLSTLTDCMARNKMKIMHVYSSDSRKAFDRELAVLCEYLAIRLCGKYEELSSAEKDCRIMLVKSCLYGLACDWFEMGMDEEYAQNISAACIELAKYIEA